MSKTCDQQNLFEKTARPEYRNGIFCLCYTKSKVFFIWTGLPSADSFTIDSGISPWRGKLYSLQCAIVDFSHFTHYTDTVRILIKYIYNILLPIQLTCLKYNDLLIFQLGFTLLDINTLALFYNI